jgi:hypothetical protein
MCGADALFLPEPIGKMWFTPILVLTSQGGQNFGLEEKVWFLLSIVVFFVCLCFAFVVFSL